MKHPQTTWWIIIVLVNQISYSQVQGNVECTEDVNKTVKITPAHHENNPRRPWEQFYVPESQESIIDDVKITCQNVSFPLQYQASTSCNNCPHILKIVSLNIGIVPPAAFFHVSDFSVLILNSLNISEILPGAFGQQPLKELYLSGNRLSEVGLAVFNSLIKLEVLDLSNNKIKTLPAHCLTGMINLKTLKLSNNNLSTFLFDVLDPNVKQISSLDLSSNIISKFVMKDGIAIANISLNNNKLTSIEFCPLMFSSLSVQNNLLKHLPFSDCNNTVNKLKYFDVSFNSINDIDTFYFENSSNLEYLYLNNNNITNIPAGVFYNLNNLKSLNLSYNNLQKFQYGTFDSLKNLTILDISNNNFVSINRSLHSVNTLEELYIQNNKISYINSKQFLKDFPKLGKICFDNNKLTCDDVIETVRDFKDVLILHYNLRNASNVYGISCSETVASTDASITEKVETETEDNNDHRGTIKNYFENSSFLTFLEKLEKQNSLKFNETQIFKYFNEEFEKSKFYKYLESLKSDHNVTDLHNQYLLNRSVNLNSEQNFQSSELYKYLESLRQAESLRSETNPETEKLISVEKTGYDKMVTILSLNAVFVLLMCFISLSISIFLYKNVFRNKSNTREQVELLGVYQLNCECGNYTGKIKKHFKKTLWNFYTIIFVTYIISSKILCSSTYCIEDVEREERTTSVPSYRYNRRYFDTKIIQSTTEVNITCENVTLPMEFHGETCDNCSRMLTILSLEEFVLPSVAFQNVDEFDTIVLNDIGIEKIAPGAFSGHLIKKIYLSRNKLVEIGVGIFNHLFKLEHLDVSHNNIAKVSEQSLLGVTNLKSLILSNNQLTDFSLSLLDPKVVEMELLDISYNQISNFSDNINIRIETFIASNNAFKSINFCPSIFQECYLNNNLIDEISTQNCNVETPVVEILDLSGNRISNLETLYFQNASKLRKLNLSTNNISVIPIEFFYHTHFLNSLDLSHNKLEYFQHGTFDPLIVLESLDLSYNNLSSVKNFLHSLSRLNFLNIENNCINYINPKLYDDLPHLQNINFENNKLKCDNLIEILRYIKLRVSVNYGTTRNTSNIHGIACTESYRVFHWETGIC